MRGISRWIALGLFASFPTDASADVISDEEGQCRSKKAGDACSIGNRAGSCAKSTCSRNDYSEGVPPKTKSVECLICELGAAPELGEPEEAQPEEAQPEEAQPEEAQPEEAQPEPDEEKAVEEPPKAETKAPEAKPAKSGGCTIGGPAPVGLGLLLLGAAAWTRRRQSSSPTP